MQLVLGQSTVRLERDQLIAVRDGKGAQVTCETGALWITQEHAEQDIVLEAGRSLVIEQRGLTLVMALGAASVRVLAPAARASLWRAMLRWLKSALHPGAIAAA
jgi:hypothetical protein